MRVHLGSTNAAKMEALKEVLALYPKFADAEVVGVEVDSGVAEQPMNLGETIDGAIHRAKSAFNGSDLSIGIEGGLLEVPQTASGVAKLEACAVYDGKEIGLGFSCAYVVPEDLHRIVVEQHVDMSEALKIAGYTNHPKIGTAGGGIGLLTDGRMVRKDMCKQALITALISVKK
jgi:inosine/xanthosine triphosphatase